VIPALTEHVDLYPTLCDLCSLGKPSWLQGSSLLPVIEDPGRKRTGIAFSHRKHMWHDRLQVYDIAHSVRTERYRYTVYLDGEGGLLYRELFDYQEDPLETENRAELPRYETTVTALTALLEHHCGQPGDQER
jgi:arylsulfatase A-like enzyme